MKTCGKGFVPEYRLRLDPERCLDIAGAKISSAGTVADFIRENFGCNAQESTYVLCLAADNRIIGVSEVSRGGIAQTMVDPRIVFQTVLAAGAPAFVLAHNHPSGNMEPSRDDDELTQNLKNSARLLHLVLLDHVIVGGEGDFYSYAAKGKL